MQSIADIADLLRERQRNGYVSSYFSESEQPSHPFTRYNILDSKVYSQREHDLSYNKGSRIIDNRRQRPQINSQLSALNSQLVSINSPSHLDKYKSQLHLQPSQVQEPQPLKPLFMRIRLEEGEAVSAWLRDQDLIVHHGQLRQKVKIGKPAQFQLRDVLEQLRFQSSRGVSVQPQENLEQVLDKFPETGQSRMVNFFYDNGKKAKFAYTLQFSSERFYTHASVSLVLRLPDFVTSLRILDLRGQLLFHSQGDLKLIQAEWRMGVQQVGLGLKAMVDRGGRCDLRLKQGEYAIEDEQGEFVGLMGVETCEIGIDNE